jgi:hypothetical protein
LDKYNKYGGYRYLWKHDKITFSKFIREMIENHWNMIDEHHFAHQTSDYYNKDKIMMSKILKIYDIENIEYDYIEKLYDKEIPEDILNYRGGHERKKYDLYLNKYVFDLDLDDYYEYNIDIKYFYNKKIKEQVYNFYKNDFDFFRENDINYEDIFDNYVSDQVDELDEDKDEDFDEDFSDTINGAINDVINESINFRQ